MLDEIRLNKKIINKLVIYKSFIESLNIHLLSLTSHSYIQSDLQKHPHMTFRHFGQKHIRYPKKYQCYHLHVIFLVCYTHVTLTLTPTHVTTPLACAILLKFLILLLLFIKSLLVCNGLTNQPTRF